MVPYFKKGEYGEGLYYGVAAIAKAIAKDARVDMPGLRGVKLRKPREEVPLWGYPFGFLFFLLWGLPCPLALGVPFVLIMAVGFSVTASPVMGILMVMGYLGSLKLRHHLWRKLWQKTPLHERPSFYGWALGKGGGGGGGGGGGAGGGW